MITIYVLHLRTQKHFCLINLFCPRYFWNILLFIRVRYFNEDCGLKVSRLQLRASWVLLRIYNVWQKPCDWEVFTWRPCENIRYVYNPKLSQICIDLHTADESTPAFCEVPGGLQEPGAVSKSPPLWRATSLGMTNNVHQHCSSYCFHFDSTLSLLL